MSILINPLISNHGHKGFGNCISHFVALEKKLTCFWFGEFLTTFLSMLPPRDNENKMDLVGSWSWAPALNTIIARFIGGRDSSWLYNSSKKEDKWAYSTCETYRQDEPRIKSLFWESQKTENPGKSWVLEGAAKPTAWEVNWTCYSEAATWCEINHW